MKAGDTAVVVAENLPIHEKGAECKLLYRDCDGWMAEFCDGTYWVADSHIEVKA